MPIFHECLICQCNFPEQDDVYCFIKILLFKLTNTSHAAIEGVNHRLPRDLGSQMFPKDLFFLY